MCVAMKYLSLFTVVCCFALLHLSLCQNLPQCRDLDVENTGAPQSGRDLTLCSTDASQCCIQNYINTVTSVARERLSVGLRLQMRETSELFNRTIDLIREYFMMGFRDSFVGSLPNFNGQVDFNTLSGIVGTDIQGFIQNIETANASQIIMGITSRIGTIVGMRLGGDNGTTRLCVRDAIFSNLNRSDIAALIRGLTTVKRSLVTLNRIAGFLYQYRMNTNFRFPRNCVRRFVELNFCGRCTRRIPPLCSNTCGALFRGCLSPYYTVLSRQFDYLWNVSRQVLRITNSTVQTLFSNERRLINVIGVLTKLGECGVSLPVGKRQAQNTRVRFIPQARMQEFRNLDGRGIRYNDNEGRGPLICRSSGEEREFCSNNTARTANNYCSARMDCTSDCRCFDGMMMRMENTREFDVDGIQGQMDNPAIDLTDSELMTVVREIGTPATSFLMQDDLVATIPDGVVFPTPDSDSGATLTTISTLLLLLGVIVTILIAG